MQGRREGEKRLAPPAESVSVIHLPKKKEIKQEKAIPGNVSDKG